MERVILSGRFTMGPETDAFEAELAAYHGRRYAVAVNSGSSANLIAVAALAHLAIDPLRRGDRVLAPALAWPTSYSPFVQYGARLALCDANESTWNVEAVRGGDRDAVAYVCVPILGNPPNMRAIHTECAKQGMHLIVDACESIGAMSGGAHVAAYGLMATLSFFYSHQLSAIEGGAILTDSEECDTLCRMLRNHGWTKGTKLQPKTFAGEYDFAVHGYNLRPLEMHCAIAREQLKKLAGFKKHRAVNWMALYDKVKHLPIRAQEWGEGEVCPFGFAFTVEGSALRERLAHHLRANSIDCRPPVGGSFSKHGYAEHANWTGDTPNADRIHDTGLFIGLAPWVMGDALDKVAKVMRAFFEGTT